MDIGIISMRYAKALLAFAQDKKVEDTLYQEFLRLAYHLHKFPQLKLALDNPVLTPKDKLELVCTATNGKDKPSPEFVRFIRLVLKQHREFCLQFMVLTYMNLYHKLKHIGVGKLITAVPVDNQMIERIRRIASRALHADMEIEPVVDPQIEGGFIFDINDYRLDASVATRLKKIKQQLIDKNKRIV